jgi:hypothetical protein
MEKRRGLEQVEENTLQNSHDRSPFAARPNRHPPKFFIASASRILEYLDMEHRAERTLLQKD